MPVQLLVAATTHAKQIKGAIIAVRDSPTTWGSKEGLPNYIVVTISNATAEQVDEYLGAWKTDFQHSVVTLPDLSKQITVTISEQF